MVRLACMVLSVLIQEPNGQGEGIPGRGPKATLTLAEVADVLGIGHSTARRLAGQDALPVRILHIGGRRVVSAVELDRYLSGSKETP